MIAAIYARKSTDDSDRIADARSTTRQIARATEYATAKGWTVDPCYVFADETVSGAEWKHRPRFNALLAMLEPAPPFGVLIVSELSRIGRASARTLYAVTQIEEAGVELHGYLKGRVVTLEDEAGEVETVVDTLVASLERRRASERTRDALRRRAEHGYVTGGRCYGYRNVRDGSFVKRVVDDSEAAVVRRIFELYASGVGMVTIAHRLNDEGVRPPRGRGWAPSGIRAMLLSPLYRGELTWGRLRKVTRKGTKYQQRRPESEWLTVPVPELRVVSDDVWQQVKARLDARAATRPGFAQVTRRYPDESGYLLVGFARCSICGGPIGTDLRAHGSAGARRHVAHYACLDHKRRGPAICGNVVGLRQDLLDRAILDAIAAVLEPPVLAVAVEKALATLTGADSERRERRGELERKLAEIQQRIDRLVTALADATMPADEIRPRLVAEKAKKTALEKEWAGLAALARTPRLDVGTLRRDLEARAADVAALLAGEPVQARDALRALLVDKIDLEPVGRGRERGYKFRGTLTIGRFLAGIAENTSGRGGPNGIRTRVFNPPRVLQTILVGCSVLTKRRSRPDQNPTALY